MCVCVCLCVCVCVYPGLLFVGSSVWLTEVFFVVMERIYQTVFLNKVLN